jgi:hypothetical protein
MTSDSETGHAHARTPQARIDDGIGHVHREGHHDHREDQQHHHRFHHDQVALGDRLKDQPPQAGQEEHVLDDDRARQQEGELQPDDRQHRDQRVAQRVMPQHGLPRVSPLARAVRM